MGKSIGRKLHVFMAGTTLAACALVIQPASLGAQEQRPPQPYGMELPGLENGGGWIGVGIDEVTGDKAKELKLPSEYGALVDEVNNDGPAAKAGIKKGDVITEYNGEHIEGTRELRRLIRETPPGHTVKISIWRDGRAQTVSLEVASMRAELGARRGSANGFGQAPPDFTPPPGPRPDGPRAEENRTRDRRAFMAPPALGVSAVDLSGQLGNYFGAPDGEGVLVTDVPASSLGGKAGLKAGDVITQVDGRRVRNLGELRDHLRSKQRQGESVKLDILRKGATVSLNVQLERPPAPPNPGGAAGRAIPL